MSTPIEPTPTDYVNPPSDFADPCMPGGLTFQFLIPCPENLPHEWTGEAIRPQLPLTGASVTVPVTACGTLAILVGVALRRVARRAA